MKIFLFFSIAIMSADLNGFAKAYAKYEKLERESMSCVERKVTKAQMDKCIKAYNKMKALEKTFCPKYGVCL